MALDSSFTAIEFFHGKLCLILSVLEKMTCSQQANLTEKDLDREILYCKKKENVFKWFVSYWMFFFKVKMLVCIIVTVVKKNASFA